MNIFKFNYLIFVFVALFSIAFGTDIIELKPSATGGKLFCVKPGKTYCENLVEYPREQVDKLLRERSINYYAMIDS